MRNRWVFAWVLVIQCFFVDARAVRAGSIVNSWTGTGVDGGNEWIAHCIQINLDTNENSLTAHFPKFDSTRGTLLGVRLTLINVPISIQSSFTAPDADFDNGTSQDFLAHSEFELSIPEFSFHETFTEDLFGSMTYYYPSSYDFLLTPAPPAGEWDFVPLPQFQASGTSTTFALVATQSVTLSSGSPLPLDRTQYYATADPYITYTYRAGATPVPLPTAAMGAFVLMAAIAYHRYSTEKRRDHL